MTGTEMKNTISNMPRIYVTPLKQFLLDLDITQHELAEKLEISPSRVSAMVKGSSVPSLPLAEKMVAFFRSYGYTDINELVFLYPDRYTKAVDFQAVFRKSK